MGIAAEALEETRHLLMHHRMARDPVIKIGLLRGCRQFPVKQEIGGFEEVPFFGQLIDRIAPIKKNAFVAIYVSDLRFTARRGGEAGIISEHPGLAVELADID